MSEYQFRLATRKDKGLVLGFLQKHWDQEHPFVQDPVFFDYYFAAEDDALRFVLAEKQGVPAALAGYIPANREPRPDIWVSYWVADPAMRGAGLELMAVMPEMTECCTLACNNIRPETRPFYEFLGYTTGRMGHFYRLADKKTYKLAVVKDKKILPVGGDMCLRRLADETALRQSGFSLSKADANPYKDVWYLARRYYRYPRQQYEVYGAYAKDGQTAAALLVGRTIAVEGAAVFRIVDYVGDAELLPRLGRAIDDLMRKKKAEYADFYAAGLAPQLMQKAGFTQREAEGEQNIIPNYLQPPLLENTDYYYFTNNPKGFRLCKADGDQDRPRTDSV